MALTYLDTAMIEQPANIKYLSAGELIATDAILESANVNELSAYNFYANNILSNADVFGNLTVYGTVSALSGIVAIETFNTSTTALSVINAGVGPALYVSQDQNTAGVATFIGHGQEILKVNNVEPDTGQATVTITKGQSNKSLSATGTSTFEDIDSDTATIDTFTSTNINATSATIGTLTPTTVNAGAINAGAINANSVTTNLVNAVTVSADSLQMPADSYAFFGNMTVYGEINALSGIQNISSFISETSSLSVVSVGQTPALYVQQSDAAGAIATFYGNDVEVLRVNNIETTPSDPGVAVQGDVEVTGNITASDAINAGSLTTTGAINAGSLTTTGAINAGSLTTTGAIAAYGGNSTNWNTAYTAVNNNQNNWILHDGNSKGAELKIGTNDNYKLSLETNNTSRVTIDTSGNVGIGTVSPEANYRLDVRGDLRLLKSSAATNIKVGTITENQAASISFVGDNNYTEFGLRLIRNSDGLNTTSELIHRGLGDLIFKAQDQAALKLTTSNTTRVTVTSGGKIGIGTTAPTDTLQVNGFVRTNGVRNNISITSTATTISAGQILGVDTTGGAITVTLPATPGIGDRVQIFDSHRYWDINNCILGNNGKKIEGLAENLECDIVGSIATLIYVDSSRGWVIVN